MIFLSKENTAQIIYTTVTMYVCCSRPKAIYFQLRLEMDNDYFLTVNFKK